MVSRIRLGLFAVALIAASVAAAPVEEDDVDVSEFNVEEFERGFKSWLSKAAKEAASKIMEEVGAFLKKEAKKVNLDCVKEVYDTCDINPVMHPKKYYKCAKNYISENKDRCYVDEEANQTDAEVL